MIGDIHRMVLQLKLDFFKFGTNGIHIRIDCEKGAWAAVDTCGGRDAGETRIDSGVRKWGSCRGCKGRGWGQHDDNDDDDSNDEDGNDEGKQKPSGGGIMLVPRAERRRSHRGMARVTTIIGGDHKRKATGEPV